MFQNWIEVEHQKMKEIIWEKYEDYVQKIINEIIDLPECYRQQGDYSGLGNVWEQFRYQIQKEESVCFYAYKQTIRSMCCSYISKLPEHEINILWFGCNANIEWDYESRYPDKQYMIDNVADEVYYRIVDKAAIEEIESGDEFEEESKEDEDGKDITDNDERVDRQEQDSATPYKNYIFAHFAYEEQGVYNCSTISILPADSDANRQRDFHRELVTMAQNAMDSLFEDYFYCHDYDIESLMDDLNYDENIIKAEYLIEQEKSDCYIAQFIIRQMMEEQQSDFNYGIGTVEGLKKWVYNFNYYIEIAQERDNYCYLKVEKTRDFALGIVKELLECVEENREQHTGFYLRLYREFRPLKREIIDLYYKVKDENWPFSQEELERFLRILERYKAIIEED